MKKISLLTVALIAGFAGVSKAEISQYVTGNVSWNRLDVKDTWNDGDEAGSGKSHKNIGGLAIGYGLDFGKGLRSDVEYTYNFDADFGDAKVKSMSLMLNGYYDIATGSQWTPYVQLGLGVARSEIKSDAREADEEDEGMDAYSIKGNKFAYQAGFGVGYEITKELKIDAGYKYANYGKLKESDEWGKDEYKNSMHTVSIGARYAF